MEVAAMKRGTTPVLPVTIDMNVELISEIEFVFKSEFEEEAPVLLMKKFPDEVSYHDNAFYIPFTEKETRLFARQFYMDTRITTVSGSIPETEICKLYMNPTLFEEA